MPVNVQENLENKGLYIPIYGRRELVYSEEEWKNKITQHENKYGKVAWDVIKQAHSALGSRYGDEDKKRILFFDGNQYVVGPGFKIVKN